MSRSFNFGTVSGNGRYESHISTYRFRVVLSRRSWDSRPCLLVWKGHKSDSACGYSQTMVVDRNLPRVPWHVAYRLRRVGGLRVFKFTEWLWAKAEGGYL
jgi:hypothetical protein